MNNLIDADPTAVEIGKRFGISAVDYASPLAFYERVADRLMGMGGYSNEMLFLIALINDEQAQEIQQTNNPVSR